MIIKFDLEASDKECAFFALYAGLRMYKELKSNQSMGTGMISISGAEAFCMLEDLKEQHPKQYSEAAAEYEQVYN